MCLLLATEPYLAPSPLDFPFCPLASFLSLHCSLVAVLLNINTTRKLIGNVTRLAWMDTMISLREAEIGPRDTSREIPDCSRSYLCYIDNYNMKVSNENVSEKHSSKLYFYIKSKAQNKKSL